MGNEAKMRLFWASGDASSGPPSRAGGGLLAELRSASILLQSSILIVFYHSIIHTDWVSQCPALVLLFALRVVHNGPFTCVESGTSSGGLDRLKAHFFTQVMTVHCETVWASVIFFFFRLYFCCFSGLFVQQHRSSKSISFVSFLLLHAFFWFCCPFFSCLLFVVIGWLACVNFLLLHLVFLFFVFCFVARHFFASYLWHCYCVCHPPINV